MVRSKPSAPGNVIPLRGAAGQAALLKILQAGGALSSFGDLFERRDPEPWDPADQPVRFTVRLDLDHAKPPIWRRLELAGDLTLAELHDVVQAAMGWTDSHLHHFVMGPDELDRDVNPFLTPFAEEEGDEGVPEGAVRLDQVVAMEGDRLFYEYDFGDGWGHTLKVEQVESMPDGAPRARCVAGRRACPPEDVGGIGGYDQVLKALDRPDEADEWTREKLDWLPAGFDPVAFDVAGTDAIVQRVAAVGGGGGGGGGGGKPSLDALAPGLADVVVRMDAAGSAVAAGWAGAAGLDAVDLDEDVALAVTARLRLLLELVGAGVKLSSAGWLPPALVMQVVEGIGHRHAVWGKGNREQNLPPVRDLRESALQLGLVRKVKGQLLLTAAGTKLRADPVGLARHIADRLPLGRDPAEQHAGWLVLLATAAEIADPFELVSGALTGLGWNVDDGDLIDKAHARHLAWSTVVVLEQAGWNPYRWSDYEHDPRARVLAQLAVRAPS